jgi:hypothetical protein
MYTTAEHLNDVKTLLKRYRRKRETRIQASLSVLCVLLSFSLLKAIGSLSGGEHGDEISGMMGAIMLYENVGSYILVGIISFMAAVAITLLCIRYRK